MEFLTAMGDLGEKDSSESGEEIKESQITLSDEKQKSNEEENDSPEYVVMVADLLKEINDNQVNARDKYVGKIVTVQGQISYIGEVDEEYYVSLADPSDEWQFDTVDCYVDKETVSKIKNGDIIKATGKVKEGLLGFELEETTFEIIAIQDSAITEENTVEVDESIDNMWIYTDGVVTLYIQENPIKENTDIMGYFSLEMPQEYDITYDGKDSGDIYGYSEDTVMLYSAITNITYYCTFYEENGNSIVRLYINDMIEANSMGDLYLLTDTSQSTIDYNYLLEEVNMATYELTESDLAGLTAQQLTYLRNSIYASHGYVFQSAELNEYFAQFGWRYEDATVTDSVLTDLERKNAGFIQEYQEKKGLNYQPK